MDKGISHVLSMSILLYGLQRPIFNSQDKEPYSFVGLKAQEKTGLLLMPTTKVTKNVSAAEGGGNVLCSILISIKTKAWLYSFRQQASEPSFQHLEVRELTHPALLRYLQERGINTALAKAECKELYFVHNGKPYFAIGFPNVAGGYEVRNRFFKGCIAPKDISHIRQSGEPREKCLVFEGMTDYLSFLTLRMKNCPTMPNLDRQDYIILNSVSNVSKAIDVLHGYERIHCLLDNDEAGRKAYWELAGEFAGRIRDFSQNYNGHKDLNDYLCGKPLPQSAEPMKQKRQVQSARRMMQPLKKRGLKI